MNAEGNNVLETALLKRAQHRGLHNSEITALSRFDRMTRRPVSDNYRPLGAIVNQLSDGIHTLQDPGSALVAGVKYTFTSCVSGAPKSFDIKISRGPY